MECAKTVYSCIFLLIFLFSFCFYFFITGTVNGPDIRKLMKSAKFNKVLNGDYSDAWMALKSVIRGVLGKERVENEVAKGLVNEMLDCYRNIGASMTLKLHFLHHHLDEFLQQLPTESDEQGERFHQVTMPMERRFKGKKLDSLLAEVCWWTQKMSLYDNEKIEDTGEGGHSESDKPLNIYATDDDNSDNNDDEGEPQAKRSRTSTSAASTSMDTS